MSRDPDISRQIPLLADAGDTPRPDCPDEMILAGYAESRLGNDRQAEVEAHLADCTFCLAQVGSLVRSTEEALPVVPSELLDALRAPKARPWTWSSKIAFTTLAAAATLIVGVTAVLQFNTETGPAAQSSVSAPDDRTVRNGASTAASLQILEPREGAELVGPQIDLHWQSIPQTLQYNLTLVSLEGDLIWESRSTNNQISVPTASLIAGERYFLWIEAQLPGGGSIKSSPVGFRMAPD